MPAVFDYIEVFYNRQRLHSHNGQLSPDVFTTELVSSVKARVLPASTVYTDDWRSYNLGQHGYKQVVSQFD
jgi:hypothetical protein